MALTALAGPAANFLTALAAVGSQLRRVPSGPSGPGGGVRAVLPVQHGPVGGGDGAVQPDPLSPLDGSKILFALLPDRIYYTILRYEKYVMGVVILPGAGGGVRQAPVLPDGPCPTGLLHPHRNASGRACCSGRVCYFKSVLR